MEPAMMGVPTSAIFFFAIALTQKTYLSTPPVDIQIQIQKSQEKNHGNKHETTKTMIGYGKKTGGW